MRILIYRRKNIHTIFFFLLVSIFSNAQEYPFTIPDNISATLNVKTSTAKPFNNKIIGYNIQGFKTSLQKEFINLVDPVTIRFPHGVWANFYNWQTDGYQDDSYDNREHEEPLKTFVCCIKGEIDGIADLNQQKKQRNNGQGFDMMWTYSINFDDGVSSVARAKKDLGLGLEVKAIELGNEHFWLGQRSLRTSTEDKYLEAATEVSSALKAEFPNIQLSLPLSWRRTHSNYNNKVKGNGAFFDAISIHKYLGADPDIPGESNNAYSSLLTAKLELEEDVNWVRTFAPGKPVWLTEWGVSAGDNVHAAACLGMADVYLFMADNQDIYQRANWFIFNRVLNSMVVVGSNREPVYPLQKRGYLSVFEIIQDVFRDTNIMESEVTSSTKLTVSRGSVNAINAKAATNKFGETKVVAINLTNKPVTFELQFDNKLYFKSYKHEALKFNNLGVVEPIDYFKNPLELVKEGSGTITLPPLSINKISGIYLDESIHLISGTIEAEAYKTGGEGVGYFDTTSTNTLNATNYTGGVDVGIVDNITYVGNTQNGEWIKYNVNVLETNDYDFDFIYATINSGTKISIAIDDTIIIDNFSFDPTPTNFNFQSAKKFTISLTKGLHELKLFVIHGGFNLDKINITKTPKIEAPIFIKPSNLDNIEPGQNIFVEATTNTAAELIDNMELFLNDVSIRKIKTPPFTWGNVGQNDTALENISQGIFTLKLVLSDVRERKAESSILITSTNYPTRPFSGTAFKIPGKIELEDYDLGGPEKAYFDSTLGNSGGVYRTDDVDIISDGTGFSISNLSGNEYVRYTINVQESGSYQMLVNYKTFSTTSKPLQAYLLPKDLSSSKILFSAPNNSTTSGIRKINEGSAYQDYSSDQFDLQQGIWILEIRIPNGGAGPSYDYVTLNRLGSLSANYEEIIGFNVYPNPSSKGIFNLSFPKKWKLFSVLGTEISKGEKSIIDITAFAKGLYFLKTEDGIIKRLLYRD